MSGGEIERREAERGAADRRLNDALTRVDQALPRIAERARRSIDLDAHAVRDRILVLPSSPPSGSGWRARLARFVWRVVAPIFQRQQEFNTIVADHLQQTYDALHRLAAALPKDGAAAPEEDLHALLAFNSALIQYLQQVPPFVDTKIRSVEAALDEVRMTAAAARRAASAARREPGTAGVVTAPAPDQGGPEAAPASLESRALGSEYVAFEDLYRGTADEIRARQIEYVDRFAGAGNVLDIGCGRGELLELFQERGISASGIDTNADMVEACRARGLKASHADALGYLRGLPDASLGGITALQVVEHLQPDYLVRMLEVAFAKLQPGALIALETINPACWVAFFESYIRDITHVRPLHPDTLKFLVVAAGFERVDVHYRSPVSESGRLQRIDTEGLPAPLADLADTINGNVDRLNQRLFTYLDYAVIGTRGK